MALRLRRGTDAERLTITPLQGELIYTTDTAKIYVGDGATQGGVLIGPYDLENDTTPQLAGDLDLNGNNITGTGNINITGTVTATGDINLGDADADSITVAGLINSNLRPATDQAYDLGSASRYWRNVFATGLEVNGQASVGSLAINGNIEADDSTIIYDSNSNSLAVSSITAQSIDGNLTGSVFGDDSTLLVDGVNSKIIGDIETGNLLVQNVEESVAVFESISGEDISFIDVSVSNGTFDNPTTLIAGDSAGGIRSKSWDGSEYKMNMALGSVHTDSANFADNYPAADTYLITAGGNDIVLWNFKSDKTLVAPGPIQPGVYADAAARDAAIPSPTAGMTIFVTDGDGAGNPKFQGNTDGTTSGWVDLN